MVHAPALDTMDDTSVTMNDEPPTPVVVTAADAVFDAAIWKIPQKPRRVSCS